jgi:hypothetical protein
VPRTGSSIDVVNRAAKRHNWSEGRTAMVHRLLGTVSPLCPSLNARQP